MLFNSQEELYLNKKFKNHCISKTWLANIKIITFTRDSFDLFYTIEVTKIQIFENFLIYSLET